MCRCWPYEKIPSYNRWIRIKDRISRLCPFTISGLWNVLKLHRER
ncbi:MAG: hypothetical protein ACMUIU_19940 [bacterium]